jgi:tetratricopeptide (TPR) repeat protein
MRKRGANGCRIFGRHGAAGAARYDEEKRMIWRWIQDWREQRAALKELKTLERDDEWRLMGDELNPLHQARVALERGQFETAGQRWEDARGRMPNFIYQSEDSLPILLGLKRFDEAEAFMNEGRRRSPRDHRWLKGLARIAYASGDIAEAARRWKAAQSGGMDSSEAWVQEGACLRALGRLDEAEAVFNHVLRLDPSDVGAWMERAKICEDRRDWPEAETRWRALTERHQAPHLFAGHAWALGQLGRFDEADAILERERARYPADLAIGITRSHLAERRGDLNAACERWAELLRVQPYFDRGYLERTKCLVHAERHVEADAVMREAIERFRNETWPLFEHAMLADRRQEWNEAVARWEAFRLRFPDRDEGYNRGSGALDAAGRHDEAAALRQAPRHTGVG